MYGYMDNMDTSCIVKKKGMANVGHLRLVENLVGSWRVDGQIRKTEDHVRKVWSLYQIPELLITPPDRKIPSS